MIKCEILIGTLALGFLVACSSTQTNEFQGKTVEYSAWFEEEKSAELEPYRRILSEKLEDTDESSKDLEDPQKYIDYLSDLDSSGKKTSVEAKLKNFIAKNPGEKKAVFLLGVHYMRNKRKELANHLFKSIEKDPKFVWKSLLFNNLGMLSLQDKERDKAMGYFEKAIAAEPTIAAPRVNLGALYLQSKSYADALPLFKRALELDGGFEDAALGLGSCLESQGKFDEAHRIYSQFTESHPNSLAVLYNDATILGRHLGKKEEASELMLRYIQRGGKESKAHEMIQGWR
jgi:tetratricopeptide (TPR) repeat protein